MHASRLEYFSSNYRTARQKFLDATRSAGAQVESIQNPHNGADGGLFTDVAIIGPKDANTILVLSSGTHGVEGFAGSGIQTGLLREQISTHLPQDAAILMIHAVNPYGMARLRRVNENNVDLNRNFVDHSLPYPPNEGYQTLAGIIAPESLSAWDNLKARLGFLLYRSIFGKAQLQQAISGGQYEYPKGLFFGGRAETWSNRTMRTVVNQYLAQAKHVVLIDVHTGLGPYAAAEVIVSEQVHSPVYRRTVEWWGTRVRNTVTGRSVSTHIKGALKQAFIEMLPAAEITAVTLEFGTYPVKDVLWALRAENWLHHYGGPGHFKAKEIKSRLLQAFRPENEEWEISVWNQGKQIIHQALDRMILQTTESDV